MEKKAGVLYKKKHTLYCTIMYAYECLNDKLWCNDRFLHKRIQDDRSHDKYHGEIIRDVQTVAELLLEPLITTLLVMDRDILSSITVSDLVLFEGTLCHVHYVFPHFAHLKFHCQIYACKYCNKMY